MGSHQQLCKTIAFTFFMLVSLLVSLANSKVQAQETTLSLAETLLENDFLNSHGGIVTLAKTVRLYHYFNAAMQGDHLWPTYNTTELRRNQAKFDLAHLTGSFWDTDYHDTKLVNAGPGMYLAIDPVVSNSFGRSSYILNFPEGTKYIDVVDDTWKNISKIKLSQQTIAALLNEGILTRAGISQMGMSGNYFTRITMQYIASEQNAKFRATISKIFTRQNIVMVAFSWEPTKLRVICKNAPDVAFNYIGGMPSGRLTGDVNSVISNEVVANAVFMSDFPGPQYSVTEAHQIELTKSFKSALSDGGQSSLEPDGLSELRALTYSCQ